MNISAKGKITTKRQKMNSNGDDSATEDTLERAREWFSHNIIRRTNWLYRVDALRPHDIREMDVLSKLVYLFRGYIMHS